jgi:hypothetical protein
VVAVHCLAQHSPHMLRHLHCRRHRAMPAALLASPPCTATPHNMLLLLHLPPSARNLPCCGIVVLPVRCHRPSPLPHPPQFMGVVIGPAVLPIAFSITWDKCSALGAVTGAAPRRGRPSWGRLGASPPGWSPQGCTAARWVHGCASTCLLGSACLPGDGGTEGIGARGLAGGMVVAARGGAQRRAGARG